MASVFDIDNLTPTKDTVQVLDSHVVSFKTKHTQGGIDSVAFLRHHSADLQPGSEQVLVLSDVQSTYWFGNLNVFINGASVAAVDGLAHPAPDSMERNAFNLTVGQNRQTMITGANLATGQNHTGLKQEFWDTQITTNMDEVKVSYFVATASIQHSASQHFTFGNETLIQWGNRTLTSWRSEMGTVVGNSTAVVEGKTRSEIRGTVKTNNYAGVDVEAMNGGVDLGVTVGLAANYQEGLTWNTTVGVQLLTHLYVGVIQALGVGASIMETQIIGNQMTAVAATLKNIAVRLGANTLNSLVGALLGVPRV